MRIKLLSLCLVMSAPAFGEETYACFETGEKDPMPVKLTINENWVDGPFMSGVFEVHPDTDFCNVSKIVFSSEDGMSSTFCFNREELKWFQTVTLFGGMGNGVASTLNTTWRCIELD